MQFKKRMIAQEEEVIACEKERLTVVNFCVLNVGNAYLNVLGNLGGESETE